MLSTNKNWYKNALCAQIRKLVHCDLQLLLFYVHFRRPVYFNAKAKTQIDLTCFEISFTILYFCVICLPWTHTLTHQLLHWLHIMHSLSVSTQTHKCLAWGVPDAPAGQQVVLHSLRWDEWQWHFWAERRKEGEKETWRKGMEWESMEILLAVG